jgi:hypothetical protein
MVLLADDAQVEADFGPFADRGNPVARYVHGFGRNRWNSLLTRLN